MTHQHHEVHHHLHLDPEEDFPHSQVQLETPFPVYFILLVLIFWLHTLQFCVLDLCISGGLGGVVSWYMDEDEGDNIFLGRN